MTQSLFSGIVSAVMGANGFTKRKAGCVSYWHRPGKVLVCCSAVGVSLTGTAPARSWCVAVQLECLSGPPAADHALPSHTFRTAIVAVCYRVVRGGEPSPGALECESWCVGVRVLVCWSAFPDGVRRVWLPLQHSDSSVTPLLAAAHCRPCRCSSLAPRAGAAPPSSTPQLHFRTL
jgi:hypothetical protein